MQATFEHVQVEPGSTRSGDSAAIDYLDEAGRLLVESAGHLAKNPPEHHKSAAASLASVVASYRALLQWHGNEPADDASLTTLARRAESFASMLRTYHNHTIALDAVALSMAGAESPNITQREGAFTGFHTARNTLTVVVRSLPKRMTEGAAQALGEATRIQSGAIASRVETQS